MTRLVLLATVLGALCLAAVSVHGQPLGEPGRMIRGLDGAPMVRVPGGGFTMGRDLGPMESPQTSLEYPKHVVDVPEFYVDVHEVTNTQFARFVKETDHATDAENDGTSSVRRGGEWVEVSGADWKHPDGPGSSLAMRMQMPVVHVSYRDAASYAKWAKKRLPTEAEWEKAARGVDERPWPWGFEPDAARANCKERGLLALAEVGSFPAGSSPWGAVDMAGNVREWTDSWLEPYPGNSALGDLYGRQYRAVRGGAWYEGIADTRVYHREFRLPRHHENVTGFRCVQSTAVPPR